MAKSKGKKQQKTKSKLLDLPAGSVLSKAKKKKLAKLKKKALSMSYCWYCEREFEDLKVLLAHQKAKHFRCPHCPRRLNTAGGLAVHIDQVHKLGTDRIANAIAGRDTFDVEIYGMEGIPQADLKEWKRRKQLEAGVTADKLAADRGPKLNKAVIPQDEFRRQLKAHKDLMEGKVAPSVAVNAFQGGPMLPPPPFMAGPPPMFPGMPIPAGMPLPPPGLLPPPGMPTLPGIPLPGLPGMPAPPGALPPPPFAMSGPPPASLPFMPGPPPAAIPPPGVAVPPPGMAVPPPGMAVPPPALPVGPPPQAQVAAPANDSIKSSAVTLKPGQVLLYGDNEVSAEEKRATLAKYLLKQETNASALSEDGPVGQAVAGRAAASDFM